MRGGILMELKAIPMTDEYAAQYFHRNGYMWARLEIMKDQENWGNLKEQHIEKELREKIAQGLEDQRRNKLSELLGKDGLVYATVEFVMRDCARYVRTGDWTEKDGD
jgi:hypothetical protein